MNKWILLFNQWKTLGWSFLSQKRYWILVIIASFLMADLSVTGLKTLFLSDKLLSAPAVSTISGMKKTSSLAQYKPIWNLNIFHNEPIPPSLSVSSNVKVSAQPRKSNLPLRLNGTVVYAVDSYSVASITLLSDQSPSFAFQIGDTIEDTKGAGMAEVTKITSERVYFINLYSRVEEYIELKYPDKYLIFKPEEEPLPKTQSIKRGIIKTLGPNQYEVSRLELNKVYRKLPFILKEAKVVPVFQNGKITGWKFKYIKPGSIYEEAGFKKNDIITSVLGELPQDHMEASRLFMANKRKSKISGVLKRGEEELDFLYNIKEDGFIEEPQESEYY